jgi:hypothetical protein
MRSEGVHDCSGERIREESVTGGLAHRNEEVEALAPDLRSDRIFADHSEDAVGCLPDLFYSDLTGLSGFRVVSRNS